MNVLPAQYMGSPDAHGVQKRALGFLEMELTDGCELPCRCGNQA